MELSNSLINVGLYDIKWAVENQYETDIKWIALNVVSLLSQGKQYRNKHKKDFKKLVGRPLYTATTQPNLGWSGWWQDVIDITAIISGQTKPYVEKCLYPLTKDENNLVSVRLRYFCYTSKRPVFGESNQLKKDGDGKPYMWIFSQGKLHPVPEQFLKEQLILWDNRGLFE